MILFAVFAVVPTVNLVRMALSSVSVTNGVFAETFTGLANAAAIPSDAVGLRSVLNTVVFTVFCVVLSVGIGLVLALLVNRSRVFSGLARRVLLLPLAIAPVVISVIWLLIADPSIGSLNRLLHTLGLPTQHWLGDNAGAMAVIVVVDVWHWTPLVFLVLFTALRGMDAEIGEAALVDGATPGQRLRFITLPLLAPMIVAITGIRFLMSLKAFDEMYLLTGGGPNDATMLLSLHIREVFFDELRLGYGSAYSVAVVLGIGVLALLGFLIRRGLRRVGGAFA